MKPKKARLWLIPLFCYGAGILVYLAACGAALALDSLHSQNGELEYRELGVNSFFLDGVKLEPNPDGGMDLVSENPDPQMIYSPGEAFRVRSFVFRAGAASRPGGEMTLFYVNSAEEDWSEHKRLWARQAPDGSWVFDLSGQKVHALRFDPDTVGGVRWRDWQITLNEPKTPASYFLPTTRRVFLLLFLPGLASAVLIEGWHILRNHFFRHKAKGYAKR